MGAWQAIGADAVGFTMIEVLRTSLGFAGARDAGRRISDPDALRAYQARPPLVPLLCRGVQLLYRRVRVFRRESS